MALEKKFQELTIESKKEGEPSFIIMPFKGDKKLQRSMVLFHLCYVLLCMCVSMHVSL